MPKSIDLSKAKSVKDLGMEQQSILKSTILLKKGLAVSIKKELMHGLKKNLGDVNVLANTGPMKLLYPW